MRAAVAVLLACMAGHVLAAGPSCKAELGEQRAAQLVQQCIKVSPATHPPCNAANSCQMIEDEIQRGCDFVGASKVAFCNTPVKDATFTGTLVGGGGEDATMITIRREGGTHVRAICTTCGDWIDYPDEGEGGARLLPAYRGRRVTVTVKEERNGGRIESADRNDKLVFVKKIEFASKAVLVK